MSNSEKTISHSSQTATPVLEHEHSPEAIRERLSAGPQHNYLRDWIYGGIDGSVTTFAVVTGVVGAQLSPVVILVLGFANLLADGFSMAASNYLGTRAEQDSLKQIEAIEHRHVEADPEGEREEVRQIYSDKGFEGEDLDRVVELITADRQRWVRTMLTEEYGLPQEVRPPFLAALSTFSAFIICGLAPLIPFIFSARRAFLLSMIVTGTVFFLIGSIKSKWSMASWWRSGFETLLVGALAAGLAYAAGIVLKRIVG
ncbi:MAG TPA: VIT1/CCC1 transporter family protein [Pyrinomonadaceae bacterium]|nr:VIT1/CCC1 transporter family protein [Pyrinomonadaceae bacterium]